MTLPLLTVITPAYNRANYIAEVIESVLSQGYPRLEYIVLDDGSTDATTEILGRYDEQITLHSHANMGETRTVNKGLAMAQGDFICVVNSDDPLLPGALHSAIDLLLANPDVVVAYPDWNCIDSEGRVINTETVPEFDYRRMVSRHHCFVGPGAVFRRKPLDRIGFRDPAFKYVADFDFWLRMGLIGPFKRIPKVLATFRVHPNSATVAMAGAEMAAEHVRLMRKYFKNNDIPSDVRALRTEAFGWAYRHAALTCKPWTLRRAWYRLSFVRRCPPNITGVLNRNKK